MKTNTLKLISRIEIQLKKLFFPGPDCGLGISTTSRPLYMQLVTFQKTNVNYYWYLLSI